MKMRKGIILSTCFLVIGLLMGCGSTSKYYKDTKLDKFETFTSVTGIEVNVFEDTEDGSGVAYSYLVDNNAEGVGAITKYEQYIKDYGFDAKTDIGSGYYAYYKDPYCLTVGVLYPSDNIIQYVMCVPKGTMQDTLDAADALQSAKDAEKDELIQELISLCEEKKYDEAMAYYNNSSLSEEFEGYKDSKKYFFYAEAGKFLEKACYGEAYDLLVDYCEGILDSEGLLKQITEKVGILDGVYLYEDPNLPGFYKHMYILNGHVEFDSASEKKAASSVKYMYNLVGYGNDLGVAFAAFGDTAVSVEYVLNTADTKKITVKKGPDASWDTFEGTYKRVSSTPVPKK